jgi:hypothetical protein
VPLADHSSKTVGDRQALILISCVDDLLRQETLVEKS